VALIGRLRYAEHRSVPEIRTHLVGRKVAVSERTVTNPLDRYDELLAVALADDRRLKKILATQKKVILGIDGLLGAMRRHRESVGKLGGAVDHFGKVSRSY
jgi:hypothetical protein